MLKDENAVSNLIALSLAGILFLGLFGVMVLQTVDQPNVEVPGNHDRLARTLYAEPVVAGSPPCTVEAKNECWLTLGLLDDTGALDATIRDAIVGGVSAPASDPYFLSEGEMAYLVDGWFSIQPMSVTRDINIIVIENAGGGRCEGENYDSPWPAYDDANVDCMKVSNGNPPCDKNPLIPACGASLAERNPDVVVINADSSWSFSAVESWFAVNPRGLLILPNIDEASDLAVAQSYLDTAVPSYLGGLYDLTFPDPVDPQAGSNGDAPVSDEDIWHMEGAIAATRPGALSNQVIVTSQSMYAPVFENLIARGEGIWLEYGERDDFDSATRILTEVTPTRTTLHVLKAWSAPSSH